MSNDNLYQPSLSDDNIDVESSIPKTKSIFFRDDDNDDVTFHPK